MEVYRTRTPLALTLAAAIAAITGCGSSNSNSTSGKQIQLVAALEKVYANGSTTVAIHVAGATKAPVTVLTSRGSFDGGAQSVQLTDTSGDVTLHTCDASASSSCAGTASITASDGDLNTGHLSVTFAGKEACATDCGFDGACAAASCTTASGVSGTCAGSPATCVAPVCTASETPKETTCSDGVDNDCNGKIDCADTACDGQPCKAGAPTWTCQSGACADSSSGFSLTVAPARTRMPPDGAAKTAVTVTVLSGTAAAPNVDLLLDVAPAGIATLSSATARTAADGTVTVDLIAGSAPGVATVTAKLKSLPAVSLSASVTLPALGSITAQNGGLKYNVMGVKESGFQESNQILLAVLDDQDQAYPAGLTVHFTHIPLGGSALSSAVADTATCTAALGCAVGITDANGVVTVNLVSGTIAGTLEVVASATVGGQTRTFNVPAVAAIGAKASGSDFSIVCSPRNVPALAETTCSTSLVDAPFTCAALLKDRYGNLLGTATQVTFVSEAAAFGHVATTPPYDPAADPASQADLGTAVEIFNTLGDGLPFDVAPVTGEPSSTYDDACGAGRVHNPRDGAVTVIAIADGEEAFFDYNGNGVYDGPGAASLAGTIYAASGEPFIDIGEPFVDANDNGQWDPGEWFMDVDGDGKYTAADGKWNANTKLWTETVVVYTTAPGTVPAPAPATGKLLGTRWVASADVLSFVDACTPTPPAAGGAFSVTSAQTGPPVVAAISDSLIVVASDGNLNRLAPAATYSVSVVAPGKVTANYRGLSSYSDETGFFFRYWPCDKDGLNCNSFCAAAPGKLPCRMQPSISKYQCGIAAGVNIDPGAQADGVDSVDWNVSLPYQRFGSGVTILSRKTISGASN